MTVDPVGQITRRTLLRGGAAAALLAVVPISLARSAGAATTSLTRSTFTPLLGTTFQTTLSGKELNLVLSAIDDLRPAKIPNDENRFALTFTAPLSASRSQGLRTFRHASLSDFDLFVSPVDRGIKAVRFEAVIDRS